MNGIFWMKGKDYYQARGWLMKQGFTKTSNYGYYDAAKTRGWQEFDNGVETVTLKCTLKRGKNGNLQCDKVFEVDNQIYDSVSMKIDKNLLHESMNKKSLYESIMKNVAKEVKKALMEYRYYRGTTPAGGPDPDDVEYDDGDLDDIFYYDNLEVSYIGGRKFEKHNDGLVEYISDHYEEIVEEQFDDECEAMYKILDDCVVSDWQKSKQAIDEYIPQNDLEKLVLPSLKKLYDEYIDNLWDEINDGKWDEILMD